MLASLVRLLMCSLNALLKPPTPTLYIRHPYCYLYHLYQDMLSMGGNCPRDCQPGIKNMESKTHMPTGIPFTESGLHLDILSN